MALKCSTCGKFLAKGTAHDHDADGRADKRHYNPHPPASGETPEGEPARIVPPRRRARLGGSPGGGPGDTRPGLPTPEPEPEPEPEDDPPARPPLGGSPGGGPGDTRPGLPTTNPDRPGDRPPPDDDDEPTQRPKPRPRRKPAPPPPDDEPQIELGVLAPQLPDGFDDYSDPGEQQGDPWRYAERPAPLTPQAPMLDYGQQGFEDDYGMDYGAPAPITPQVPQFDYEEYGAGTFDDTSKWWQSPDSLLWLPQSREREDFGDLHEEYGAGTFDDTSKWWQSPDSLSFAMPEPIPEVPWYSRGMTSLLDAPLPFAPYDSLRGVAEDTGRLFSAPHEGAWWLHDRITGQESGLSAPQRSFDVIPNIHPADFVDFLTMWQYKNQTAGLKGATPWASINPLSLIPGQDLARDYSDDRSITGADWIAAAELGLEFVPIGAVARTPIRGARMLLPTRFGGGFSSVTSPATSVAKAPCGQDRRGRA